MNLRLKKLEDINKNKNHPLFYSAPENNINQSEKYKKYNHYQIEGLKVF